MKVAIIGAGVSGLAAAQNAVQYNLECVVFEATDTVGGTWAYTDEVLTDEHDVPVRGSIYKSLRFVFITCIKLPILNIYLQ